MTTYVARMMDAASGGEGHYRFEGPDDLLERRGAARVLMHFLDDLDRREFPHQHVAYELNGAFKNREHGVVTGMGTLEFENGATLPFLVMISRE
ncbi:MAG: hypothetical protein GVY33_09845 [Alphaproteobacteria bacterium]|jgi:hypothetical protein|nr:hypothetical protein [Alphaproteobacteria bacterium]